MKPKTLLPLAELYKFTSMFESEEKAIKSNGERGKPTQIEEDRKQIHQNRADSMTNLWFCLPVYLLLRVCSLADAATTASELSALAALKATVVSSSIPPFSCIASWNFSGAGGSEPCRSFTCGISCSADGRITAVALDPAGYSGHLPDAISNLSHLETLDLSNNNFHGPIPSSLSSLTNLQHLVLTSNSFTGQIPWSFSNLSSLKTLELARNSFYGVIPSYLSSLSALAIVDLSYNRLSGPLPSSFPPNLVTLAIRGNLLTGSLIRSAFEPLQGLEVVDLAENRLSGKLEGWLLRLPKIQQVNLANNTFDKWEVWPAAGASGEELVALDLGYNRIEGRLPAELAGYPSLVAVTVSHNKLRGAIPWQYHREKKGVAFRRLFLDGNYLAGRVPAELVEAEVSGSFGDNCLEGCPPASTLCAKKQKPEWICRILYCGGGGPRRRGNPCVFH
ncbi:LRR receptor-like serine/threonine-protein kinase FLS2 [Apostasia shenzhenica]|uniref:LRR receptor-like serine/threonine-protein kinase FLS2 n=1 Tax=Apostasia shenzhenica TaxID=1088818 RepID=A0A2I0AWL8_9ASPA|nr:LRR receptor-like serine/threonine-protein kinase FLS2 [Apostasia shenzhenica]